MATYGGLSPNLVAYDFSGNILYNETTLLNHTAWSGVAMLSTVDPTDNTTDIIAADDTKIIRIKIKIDGTGMVGAPLTSTFWGPTEVKSPSISPVFMLPDKVVTAFNNGTIIVHNVNTMEQMARKKFNVKIKNTPCVNGSTIYVLTNIGLKAIDVFVDPLDPLKERWTFGLKENGNGGASPTFFNNNAIFNAIFFDGKKADDKWYAIAVNTDGTERWSKQIPTRVPGSMSIDPRDVVNNPSIWYFTIGGRLTRVNAGTGTVIETLSPRLLGGVPSTIALMAGTSSSPVMVVGSWALGDPGITAIELIGPNNNKVLWRADRVLSFGQLAILKEGIIAPRFRVVTSELSTGIVYIGE